MCEEYHCSCANSITAHIRCVTTLMWCVSLLTFDEYHYSHMMSVNTQMWRISLLMCDEYHYWLASLLTYYDMISIHYNHYEFEKRVWFNKNSIYTVQAQLHCWSKIKKIHWISHFALYFISFGKIIIFWT